VNQFDLLSALGRGSLIGAFVAMAAGLALVRLRPRIPAGHRAWIWWLVAAHFIVALVPTFRWVLPVTVPGSAFHSVATPMRAAGESASTMTARIVEAPNAGDT
jgi:hypothetical protein